MSSLTTISQRLERTAVALVGVNTHVLMSDEAGVVLHVVKLIQEENMGSC